MVEVRAYSVLTRACSLCCAYIVMCACQMRGSQILQLLHGDEAVTKALREVSCSTGVQFVDAKVLVSA